MRAIRYHSHGGPEVLQMDQIDRPTPKSDEVQAEVHALGVNPVDTYFRSGTYSAGPLPSMTGTDFAGVVTEVGSDVTAFESGDRVFGTGFTPLRNATYAEFITVPTDQLAILPEPVPFEDGAAIGHVGATAWRSVIDKGQLQLGETCLIHGGSGGVGHVAVQLAVASGAKTITTAGNEEYKQKLRSLGADAVFDYAATDLARKIQEVGSPNVILDHRIQDYLEFDIDIADDGGRIVGIGGFGAEFSNAGLSRNKDLSFHMMGMGSTPNIDELLSHLAELLADGSITVEISAQVPFEETAKAQRMVVDESHFGKIVVTMD